MKLALPDQIDQLLKSAVGSLERRAYHPEQTLCRHIKLSYKILAIQQELTNTYEYISKYDALLYLADLYPYTPLHIKVQAYNGINW